MIGNDFSKDRNDLISELFIYYNKFVAEEYHGNYFFLQYSTSLFAK